VIVGIVGIAILLVWHRYHRAKLNNLAATSTATNSNIARLSNQLSNHVNAQHEIQIASNLNISGQNSAAGITRDKVQNEENHKILLQRYAPFCLQNMDVRWSDFLVQPFL
jgi:hypothetical protein